MWIASPALPVEREKPAFPRWNLNSVPARVGTGVPDIGLAADATYMNLLIETSGTVLLNEVPEPRASDTGRMRMARQPSGENSPAA